MKKKKSSLRLFGPPFTKKQRESLLRKATEWSYTEDARGAAAWCGKFMSRWRPARKDFGTEMGSEFRAAMKACYLSGYLKGMFMANLPGADSCTWSWTGTLMAPKQARRKSGKQAK